MAETIDHLEFTELYSSDAFIKNDFNSLKNNCDSALAEAHRINPETLEETYQVQILHDRIKAMTHNCQIFRLYIDRLDHHAKEALNKIKTISVSIESNDTTHTDADL